MKADYPLRFINSVMSFKKSKVHGDGSFKIPPHLFVFTKPFRSIEILYCKYNEIK